MSFYTIRRPLGGNSRYAHHRAVEHGGMDFQTPQNIIRHLTCRLFNQGVSFHLSVILQQKAAESFLHPRII